MKQLDTDLPDNCIDEWKCRGEGRCATRQDLIFYLLYNQSLLRCLQNNVDSTSELLLRTIIC